MEANVGVVSWNVKSFLFQAIQFSMSIQVSSIWPIDRTLSVATILDQSKPESYGNEGFRNSREREANQIYEKTLCLKN